MEGPQVMSWLWKRKSSDDPALSAALERYAELLRKHEAMEARLAERKPLRIRQQAEAKQRYWAEQRNRWQRDPLRQSL